MRTLCFTLFCALLSATVLTSPRAQDQATYKAMRFRPIASVKGSDVYREYCAACHGEDLKGHGPNAAALRVPPPDLTTLSARNGGSFPRQAVEDSIMRWKDVPRSMADVAQRKRDAEEGVVRDQTPVMPAFGPLFAKLYPQEVNDRTIRIANLIAYIKSMQGH